jgi:hypothetical protein
MHTETETQQLAELRQLARQARDYQTEQGWSDAQMLREIPQLGSTKTYKRILDEQDDLEELNIANQLKGYKAAAGMIELRRKDDRAAQPEYDDFSNVTDSLAAISRALTEDSLARFVAIEGENGTGKDAVKNALLKRWAKITLATEANEFWRDSLAAPVNNMVEVYNKVRQGQVETHIYPMKTFENLVAAIGDQRLVLLVNEAHHLGPRGLNLVKSLINRCPRLVIVAEFIPALLRRLLSANYEEAIQLFGNRLCERVQLQSPPVNEVLTLLERRGVQITDPQVSKAVCDEMASQAKLYGNWRYVNQFQVEARKLCKNGPLTLDHFVTARTKVRGRRIASHQQRQAQTV